MGDVLRISSVFKKSNAYPTLSGSAFICSCLNLRMKNGVERIYPHEINRIPNTLKPFIKVDSSREDSVLTGMLLGPRPAHSSGCASVS